MNSDPSPPTASAGAEASALALTLRALRPLLANSDVTELCINRPQGSLRRNARGLAP